MQSKNVQILFTRPLEQLLIQKAEAVNISIDAIQFIDTIPVGENLIRDAVNDVASKQATIIFTSMNAAEIVGEMVITNPEWAIFCIGNTTKKIVAEHFGENRIAGTARDASSLGELIAGSGIQQNIFFFCGDQRREDLPLVLARHGIEIREIVVYKTIELNKKINNVYDGIAFFSPSAVRSFFNENKVGDNTVLFAIGKTTAGEIRNFANNKIIVSEEAGKSELLDTVLDYYKQAANNI